jgi:hypothetical protein
MRRTGLWMREGGTEMGDWGVPGVRGRLFEGIWGQLCLGLGHSERGVENRIFPFCL